MDAKEVANKVLESINDGTYRKVAENFYAADAALKDTPTGRALTGPDGAVSFTDGWMSAFPDAKIEVLDQVVEGGKVETTFVVRGTFSGTMPAPDGVMLDGDGQSVEFEVTQEIEVVEGKIVSATTDYDINEIMEQVYVDIDDEMDDEEDTETADDTVDIETSTETDDVVEDDNEEEPEADTEITAQAGVNATAEIKVEEAVTAEHENGNDNGNGNGSSPAAEADAEPKAEHDEEAVAEASPEDGAEDKTNEEVKEAAAE